MLVDATVGVNDLADWVGVEREQKWSKDRVLGYSVTEHSRMRECTAYLDGLFPS